MKKTKIFILFAVLLSVFIAGCSFGDEKTDTGGDAGVDGQSLGKNADYEVVEKSNIDVGGDADEKEDIKEDIGDGGLNAVTGRAVIDSVETNEENYFDMGINVIDNKPVLEPRVQKFIDNARKVKKYSYKARYPESYGRRHVYVLISDNKIRVMYPQQEFIVMKDSYDNIYIDTELKEAVAYCEDKIRCSNVNMGDEVDYETHLPKTPIDWTMELFEADNLKVIGNEYNHDRSLLVVEYELNGILYRQSLTDRYGASKVYINYGPKVEIIDFEFKGEGFGEDDIVHQYVY